MIERVLAPLRNFPRMRLAHPTGTAAAVRRRVYAEVARVDREIRLPAHVRMVLRARFFIRLAAARRTARDPLLTS